MKKVSIIIPCHNEVDSIPLLYIELKKLIETEKKYLWQILFVNDGSNDNTLSLLKQLHDADERVDYVNLSRNFGKESAMLAGLDIVSGDCAIIMDADLQHPPTVIPNMIKLWEDGSDDVYARRNSRGKESFLRKHLTMCFYKLLNKAVKFEIPMNVGDFRLLDRKCIEALRQMRETERYSKGLFCWIGFKKSEVEFDQADRIAGKSNWNLLSLFNLAVEGIVSFTTSPLRLSTALGFLIAICSFIVMIYYIVKTLIYGDPVAGFPTLMTVILLLGGIQLIAIGILGEYIGRIFNEVKNRPVYFISDSSIPEKKK